MNIKSTMQIVFSLILLLVVYTNSRGQTIYQTDRMGIIATELESGRSTQILHPALDYPGGIWVDTATDQLYWADLFAQTVMTAPTDSTKPGIHALANAVDHDLGWPTDVYVHADSETIYFSIREGSEFEKESALISMNYEGQILDTLLNESDGLDRPNGIAYDEANNIIYLADQEEGVFRVSPYNDEISGPLENETDYAHSVALDQQNAKLYVLTTDDEIQKMNTDGSEVEVLVDSGFVEGGQIKLDLGEGKMYWTSEGDSYDDIPGRIQRANLDGSEVESVWTSEDDSFSGLFLDTENDKLYVMSRGQKAILTMDMAGTNGAELYNRSNSGVVDAREMVYNEDTDELIWTRDGDTDYDQPYHLIKTAASGEGKQEVFFSSFDEINAIKLDESNDRLFWSISEGYEAQIYVGNLDGSEARMLTEFSSSSTTRIRDIEYKSSSNELFWLVDGRERIRGVHKMEVDQDTSTRINETNYLTDLIYSPSNDSLYVYGYSGIMKMATDGSGSQNVIASEGRPGDLKIAEGRLYWGQGNGLFSSDLSGADSMLVSSRSINEVRSFVFGPDVTFTSTDELDRVTTPHQISLQQNYPNPFNPSTNIQFSVPKATHISLTVYNMLGQEVATIYEGRVNAGEHNLNFNAGQLSSGVYLYRLKAGNFSLAKKFTLIK